MKKILLLIILISLTPLSLAYHAGESFTIQQTITNNFGTKAGYGLTIDSNYDTNGMEYNIRQEDKNFELPKGVSKDVRIDFNTEPNLKPENYAFQFSYHYYLYPKEEQGGGGIVKKEIILVAPTPTLSIEIETQTSKLEDVPEQFREKIVEKMIEQKTEVIEEKITRSISKPSTGGSLINLSFSNTSNNTIKNAKIVEIIPKTIAQNASEIKSNTLFIVLVADPVIQFELGNIKPNQSTSINYSVEKDINLTQFASTNTILLAEQKTPETYDDLGIVYEDEEIIEDITDLNKDETITAPLEEKDFEPKIVAAISSVALTIIILLLIGTYYKFKFTKKKGGKNR